MGAGQTKTDFQIALERLTDHAAGCDFQYEPPTAQLKTQFGGAPGGLTAVTFSVFRPYKRNLRFNDYISGLRAQSVNFRKIFPASEGWIMRVYYDESLLSQNYQYDFNAVESSRYPIPPPTQNEADIWRAAIDHLRTLDFVQLVKIDCPKFKDTDSKLPEYHYGYFTTIARYFTMFDSDIDAFVSRELDDFLSVVDKNHIDTWLASDKLFLLYRIGDYGTWFPRLNCIADTLKTRSRKTYDFVRDTRTVPSGFDFIFACHWGAKKFCGSNEMRSLLFTRTNNTQTNSYYYMPLIGEAIGHAKSRFHWLFPQWKNYVDKYRVQFASPAFSVNYTDSAGLTHTITGPLTYAKLQPFFDAPDHLPTALQEVLLASLPTDPASGINDSDYIPEAVRSLNEYYAMGNAGNFINPVCVEMSQTIIHDMRDIKDGKILSECRAVNIHLYKYGIDEVMLNYSILPYIVESGSYMVIPMYSVSEIFDVLSQKKPEVLLDLLAYYHETMGGKPARDILGYDPDFHDRNIFVAIRKIFDAYGSDLYSVLPYGPNTISTGEFFQHTSTPVIVNYSTNPRIKRRTYNLNVLHYVNLLADPGHYGYQSTSAQMRMKAILTLVISRLTNIVQQMNTNAGVNNTGTSAANIVYSNPIADSSTAVEFSALSGEGEENARIAAIKRDNSTEYGRRLERIIRKLGHEPINGTIDQLCEQLNGILTALKTPMRPEYGFNPVIRLLHIPFQQRRGILDTKE